MLDVFQWAKLSANSHKIRILETRVQILDNQAVENIFYQELQRNCVNLVQTQSMALELHTRARIYMSDAVNEGLAS